MSRLKSSLATPLNAKPLDDVAAVAAHVGGIGDFECRGVAEATRDKCGFCGR